MSNKSRSKNTQRKDVEPAKLPDPIETVEIALEPVIVKDVAPETVEVAAPVVATTERAPVSSTTPEQASKQFEKLVANANIPAERKTGSAENARWFLRKGWIFCTAHPDVEDLRRLAQLLA